MKKNDGLTYGQLEQIKELEQMSIDTTSNQTIANPNVSGLLSSELLLSRIEMYRQRLEESKTVSEKEYRMMMSALFGVKLIIGDLLIDNNG